MLVYYSAIALVALLFLNNRDLRDFALIGEPFITKSEASAAIKPNPNYHYYKTSLMFSIQPTSELFR